MASVNKVILVGNLGNDPKIGYTTNGKAVANISIATSSSWHDKEKGTQETKTEWHKVVFFNKIAEIVERYLKKGSQIYVEGSIQTKKWQDKNGVDRYTTEIIGHIMQMLGKGSVNEEQKKVMQKPQSQIIEDDPFIDDDIPF